MTKSGGSAGKWSELALKMQHGRMSGRGLGWVATVCRLMRRREAQSQTEYRIYIEARQSHFAQCLLVSWVVCFSVGWACHVACLLHGEPHERPGAISSSRRTRLIIDQPC